MTLGDNVRRKKKFSAQRSAPTEIAELRIFDKGLAQSASSSKDLDHC